MGKEKLNTPNVSEQNKIDQYRRSFIGGAAALAGLTIAPGIFLQTAQAKPADQAVTSKISPKTAKPHVST